MTLPFEKNDQGAQNSISMAQINVELFLEPNVPISLNQVTVRNLLQKTEDQSRISLWDGFGKSNIGKPKNPVFTNITQISATVSWGASEGICNSYTVTVKDAETDTIVYGTVQTFTTLPLALTANLTGLTVLPIISAAGTPTATTFNSVAGFSVAFTYSTNGTALVTNTWYRIAGNSNTAYNKVVQVISSADATHAVLFYPGSTPGTWGSGSSTIVKIETITSAGVPAQYTHNSVAGFSVAYNFTSLGSSELTVGSWYRIEGNSNTLYNNYVQVISSASATQATVFYRTNPGTYGSGTTTIVDDSKTGNKTIFKTRSVSSAAEPTPVTYNSVAGFSVTFTYPNTGTVVTTAGVFLASNSWCWVSGNSNPAYNQYVQVISSPDPKKVVLFYPTNPGVYGGGITVIRTSSNYTVHLLAANTNVTPLPTAETLVDLLTLEYVPLLPTTPVVDVVSKNILKVTSNATYASSYDIYEVISGTDTLIASSVSMPYDHAVLTYSLHTYKVRGRSTAGLGPISSAAVATRSLPDFPIAVPTATCSLITSSSVRVTWTASASPVVINYRVIATLAVSPFTEVYNSGLISNLLRSIDPSATSSPAASFNPATLYTIKVQTINEAGMAETTTSFTTKTAQPAAPTATATSQTAITVTWGTTIGADSYVLYKDGVSLGTKTSPFDDTTGITVHSLHSYQVSAVNVSGESALSIATYERSWPEVPVAVTNVVLTPDMNSIASQWTLAATTSTRTADSYQVYTYLKTNMSTPVDTSAVLSSTTNTSNTTTQLVGWTQYTIRIYTLNRAGSAFIDTDITTLADIRPDPLNASIGSFVSQEPGATNIQIPPITIGTFQPNYNAPGISISASNGQFQAGTSTLTTGWVSTATVIPDGSGNIVFQARMNASSSETTTVICTYTIGGGTRSLDVTTRDPNPPSGVSASGGIGMATVSWTNAGYTYIVSGGGQTKTVSGVSSVVLGDSVGSRLSGGYTMFSVQARNSQGGTSNVSVAFATVTQRPVIRYLTAAENPYGSSRNEGSAYWFYFVSKDLGTTPVPWTLTGNISTSDFATMSVGNASGGMTVITPVLSGTVYGTWTPAPDGPTSGYGQLNMYVSEDLLSEGPETMTWTLGSGDWDITNSPPTATINDTSLTPRDQSISLSSYRVDRFTTITFSISGGEPGGSFVVDRIDSTDWITDQNNIFSGTLNNSGAYSVNGGTNNAGNCRFRVTFATDGHIRYTPTLEVLTIESLTWINNPATPPSPMPELWFNSVFPGDSVTANYAVTGNLPQPATLSFTAGPTTPMYGLSINDITIYGTVTVTASFTRTGHTTTSPVLIIKKAAPSVPQGTMAYATPAKDSNGEYISGTIQVGWNITPNVGGPLEYWGVRVDGGYSPVVSVGPLTGYALVNGLTNGQQYSFTVFPYNSDNYGTAYAAINGTPQAPVVYSMSCNPDSGPINTTFTITVQGPAGASVSISYVSSKTGISYFFTSVTTNSSGTASTQGTITGGNGATLTFTGTYPGGITRTCTFTVTV